MTTQILLYMLFFLSVGGVGMAIANRKADPVVRKQRWLKYGTYLLITSSLILSILSDVFFIPACIIAVLALAEFARVSRGSATTASKTKWMATWVFLLSTVGFLAFSFLATRNFVLFIYFQVVVFDGFCQITGQLWGRNKLAPKISPAKTVEGLFGGWTVCVLTALLTAAWIPLPPWQAILSGIFTGASSLCGDLLASGYKRKTGVRDYSNWLPGQGGFLDRFDSLIFTGSCYAIFLLSWTELTSIIRTHMP